MRAQQPFKRSEPAGDSGIDFSFLGKPCQETNIVQHVVSFSSFDLTNTHMRERAKDGISSPCLHPLGITHLRIPTWGSGRHLRQTEVRQMKPEGRCHGSWSRARPRPFLGGEVKTHSFGSLGREAAKLTPSRGALHEHTSLLSGDERKLATAVL